MMKREGIMVNPQSWKAHFGSVSWNYHCTTHGLVTIDELLKNHWLINIKMQDEYTIKHLLKSKVGVMSFSEVINDLETVYCYFVQGSKQKKLIDAFVDQGYSAMVDYIKKNQLTRNTNEHYVVVLYSDDKSKEERAVVEEPFLKYADKYNICWLYIKVVFDQDKFASMNNEGGVSSVHTCGFSNISFSDDEEMVSPNNSDQAPPATISLTTTTSTAPATIASSASQTTSGSKSSDSRSISPDSKCSDEDVLNEDFHIPSRAEASKWPVPKHLTKTWLGMVNFVPLASLRATYKNFTNQEPPTAGSNVINKPRVTFSMQPSVPRQHPKFHQNLKIFQTKEELHNLGPTGQDLVIASLKAGQSVDQVLQIYHDCFVKGPSQGLEDWHLKWTVLSQLQFLNQQQYVPRCSVSPSKTHTGDHNCFIWRFDVWRCKDENWTETRDVEIDGIISEVREKEVVREPCFMTSLKKEGWVVEQLCF